MKLIIGGFAQGKREYAEARYPGYALVDDVHLLVRRELREVSREQHMDPKPGERTSGEMSPEHAELESAPSGSAPESPLSGPVPDPNRIYDRILRIAEDPGHTVFISDEIGNGIVPMDASDRLWRDVTGKVLIRLAAESDEVIRVCCGIGQRIK